MLGLRFFACSQCETVYAVPEGTDECSRCDGGRLAELPSDSRAGAYFSGAMARDHRER